MKDAAANLIPSLPEFLIFSELRAWYFLCFLCDPSHWMKYILLQSFSSDTSLISAPLLREVSSWNDCHSISRTKERMTQIYVPNQSGYNSSFRKWLTLIFPFIYAFCVQTVERRQEKCTRVTEESCVISKMADINRANHSFCIQKVQFLNM
jgi:hypothetical protein